MRNSLLFVCLFLFVAGAVSADDHESGRFWYVVDNIQSVEEDASVLVWVTLPPVWHGQQVEVSNITPEPVAILDDPNSGNRIIEWYVEPEPWQMAPETDPRQIYFHFDVELGEVPLHFPAEDFQDVEYDRASEEVRRYTEGEMWIQVDGPVATRARELTEGVQDSYDRGRAIFDWAVDNLQFVPGALEAHDAESVLAAGKGDCGQFSVLYVAMCRSVGIPARTLSNQWVAGGRHTLAEIMMPGGNWIPVDLAVAQMLAPGYEDLDPEELEAFMARRGVDADEPGWFYGNMGSGRIVVTLGNNIRFESPTLGHPVSQEQMAPGGSQAIPEAYRIEGLNRSIVHGGFYAFGEDARDQDHAHELTHQHLSDLFFLTEVDAPAPTCKKGPEFRDDGIQTWLNLGKVYMHKGEYYKAESSFKRAQQKIEQQKREKSGLLAWTHNYLGNCYDMLDQREMALEEYRAAVDLNTNYRGARDYAERYLAKPFVHRIH